MGSRFFVFALIISVSYSYTTAKCINEEWPKECGKYYCSARTCKYERINFAAILENQSFSSTLGNETDERVSTVNDVAGCGSRGRSMEITMIKDKNNVIWYVPQTPNFNVTVRTEECIQPGRVSSFKNEEVHCVAQRMHYQFPVLSRNQKTLELMAPHGGIPLHCSAKILKKP